MKYIVLYSLLFLNVNFVFSQTSDKIQVVDKTSVMIFRNGERMDMSSGFYSLAPDSQSVALIKYRRFGKETELKIYDADGAEKKTFTVDALGQVALASDGRFVVYGSFATANTKDYKSFSFYNAEGVKSSREIHGAGSEMKCEFSPAGTFIILEGAFMTGTYTLYILDNSFNMTGQAQITNSDKLCYIGSLDFNDERKEASVEMTLVTMPKSSRGKRSFDYKAYVFDSKGKLLSEKKLKKKD
jgi:hypothetical protein